MARSLTSDVLDHASLVLAAAVINQVEKKKGVDQFLSRYIALTRTKKR